MLRNAVSILALLLALVLLLLVVPPSSTLQPAPSVPLVPPTATSTAEVNVEQAKGSDLVMFNQSSKKYHCPSCRWARECTRNCVKLTRAEARRLGGVACKTCKGECAQ